MPWACELVTYQSGISKADCCCDFGTVGRFISYLLWTCGWSLMVHLASEGLPENSEPQNSTRSWPLQHLAEALKHEIQSRWSVAKCYEHLEVNTGSLVLPFWPLLVRDKQGCHRSSSIKAKKDSSIPAVGPFTNRPLFVYIYFFFLPGSRG